jgi:type VII secretion integral membrane protein EccD
MSAFGSVRVTVASQTRRVDLVLPGAVPVAELVPELARSVGLLEPRPVHDGYRLATLSGRVLAGDTGLIRQGIEHGALLTVVSGSEDLSPRVYDDSAEAVADIVERDVIPWDSLSGRRTTLATAALMMTLAAVPLVLRPGGTATAAAASVALALTTAAIVVSRARGQAEIAVVLAWLGAGYAGVAGFTLAPAGPMSTLPVVCGGVGASTAGVASLIGLEVGRSLMIAPIVVGGFFGATGLAIGAVPVDPAVVVAIALTLVAMVGSSFTRLALGASRATIHELRSIEDITGDPGLVDAEQVRADVAVAHQILIAVSAASGLIVVGMAPLAVSLGPSGTLLSVACCLAVLLRTRHQRARSQVLVDLVAGIAGLLCVAISVLCLYPNWGVITVVSLGATGTFLIAVLVLTSSPSVGWGRAGDLAERTVLLALPSLLAVSTGAVAAVLG